MKSLQLVCLLENLRSLYNIGSIFRSADAFAVDQLILVGTTGHPTPSEPWRVDHQRLHKTALGAETGVAWDYAATMSPVLAKLKQNGFLIVGLELHQQALPLAAWRPTSDRVAVIIGNEVSGIEAATLQASDQLLAIPMQGSKESLNVAVAAAIACHWLRSLTRN